MPRLVWVSVTAIGLLACKPDGRSATPAPAETVADSEPELSPQGEDGRFAITFENRCERAVTLYFAPLTDDYTPGEVPEGAQALTLAASDRDEHPMEPEEGAWLVDERVGTTARTAFGDGSRGWHGTVAIGEDCRSFAD